jgi:hypothetical protein
MKLDLVEKMIKNQVLELVSSNSFVIAQIKPANSLATAGMALPLSLPWVLPLLHRKR